MLSPSIDIEFGGHRLVLDAGGALFWPEQRLLVVSDLHLEKSTFLARHGSFIAPYDSQDTLDRLDQLIVRYCPKELLFLGDSFHDREAWQRLNDHLRERIVALGDCVERVSWIEGNHDVVLHRSALQSEETRLIENILFRHDYAESVSPQVIGHYHPKTSISVKGRRVRGKCFAHTENLLIMPAFGTYTGGLDITHQAFLDLAQGNVLQCYLIQPNSIVKIPKRA